MAKKRFFVLPQDSDPVRAPWDNKIILYSPGDIINSEYMVDDDAADPEKPSEINVLTVDGREFVIKIPALDLYADDETPGREYLEVFHRRLHECKMMDGNRVVHLSKKALKIKRDRMEGKAPDKDNIKFENEVDRSFLLRGVRRIRRIS